MRYRLVSTAGIRAAALALLAFLLLQSEASAQAQNQNQLGASVRVDEGNGGVIFEPLPIQPRPIEAIVVFEPQLPAFVFKVKPLALPGPGCQYDPRDLVLPNVLCVAGALPGRTEVHIRLVGGPRQDRFVVKDSVPPLPGPNVIQGGRKKDVIRGGQSDEKIKAGKGNDNVNPGPGNDKANLGPGNDAANTVDGKVDHLNGGKGNDRATVDDVDKVKNVERVKRK